MKKSIPLLVTFILLSAIPSRILAESISRQDTIFADDTWSADTVRITGNILVWDDVILTIEPGTRVEFQGNYSMYIHGTILAEGGPGDSILFTVADTLGYYDLSTGEGGWSGILFYNGAGYGGPDGAMIDNDSSRFDHCILEFVKPVPSNVAWSAIEVGAFSRLVIQNCEFRYNYTFYRGGAIRTYFESDIRIMDNYFHHNRAYEMGGAIFLSNSSPIISGNIIEYNSTLTTDVSDVLGSGGGIAVVGMKPIIRNNLIRYNSASKGAGIFLYNSFGLIKDNTIAYNSAYPVPPDVNSWGGGIAILKGSAPDVVNNFIANNTADEGGGLYMTASEPEVFGNLIVNNTANITGGGIISYGCTEVIANNTIAHNSAGTAGAIEFSDSEPLFMNNIIWNNPDLGGFQIKLLGYFVNLHIQNSIIQNGAGSIYGESTPTHSGLLDEYPEFGSVSGGIGAGFEGLSGDWSIDATSPCVNQGIMPGPDLILPIKDLAGNPRIRHSVIDIGPYEVSIPSITAQDTIKTDRVWIADTVKVTGDLVIADSVILTILPGTWVIMQDRYKITVLGTIKAAGTETKQIYFTVADTAGSWDRNIPDGSWKGIFFDNEVANNAMEDNEPSVFRYCNIEYVKSLEEEAFWHSALYINHYNGVSLSHCTFRNNSAVYEPATLFIRLSEMDVSNCRFYNNQSNNGSAIWAEGSDITIENCEFRDNWAQDLGGAVNTSGGNLILSNCEFVNNHSNYQGGAVYLVRTKARIHHSRFINNSSNHHGGAIYTKYENLQLLNNLIANNSGNAGGGVYALYIDDVLTMNNTICNNWGRNGGGMYTVFANHTSINDILYGNDVELEGRQYGMYSVTATVNFRNTNLEGGTGGIGFWIGQELTGTYTDIIDSMPGFLNPSEGPGNIFDGTAADWRLKSISPCINNGTNTGLSDLGETDLWGNPRIYDSIIDIGAFESQYGLPVIRKQPENYIGCAGDTMEFRVRTRFESFYQWQKDGEDIPGATGPDLLLENISADDDGNYQCIVSNAFGSIETAPVYLLARAAPEILRQPQDIWAIEDERTVISLTGTGTPPLHFQWYKDGTAMPGKIWPDLWISNTGAGDEGVYYCEVSNECSTVQSDAVQLYMAPQICMVTVDSVTKKNLVIWEKNTSAPIASYNIYRESIVAGQYDPIGNVPADALSVFTDEEAIPAEQAYIYKITALTADDEESDLDLCRPHKTIHLLMSRNYEWKTAQLDWDDYYGFDYWTYYIYRRAEGDALFSIAHEMASSTSTWTDITAAKNVIYYYRVAVLKEDSCNPTGNVKAGVGIYTHSLSNLDDNKKLLTGIDGISAGTLKIYPNPFSQRTTVEFPNPGFAEYRIIIRDLSGKAVRMERTTRNRFTIERGDLEGGLYSIELVGDKVYRDRFIIR